MLKVHSVPHKSTLITGGKRAVHRVINTTHFPSSETLMKSLILLLIAFAALLAVVDAQWGFYGHPHYYGPPHPPYHPPYWHPPHFHYDPYHGPHWHGWHKK
ncbi:hypothetical protein QR680_007280 [Steinernema hermaphroditum]|uniref:Uncharacterized protein n=1 Tax=Steinernema hermaphroditum TaxID=289476 RepID=A0AA39HZW0_9BILA|nr:hypothetical protein QR680_007280 [Steinernema hermaphroditum]